MEVWTHRCKPTAAVPSHHSPAPGQAVPDQPMLFQKQFLDHTLQPRMVMAGQCSLGWQHYA